MPMQLPDSWGKRDQDIARKYANSRVAEYREKRDGEDADALSTHRMARAGGMTLGIALAKAEAGFGEAIPSFDVPGLGDRRISTILSWPVTAYYMFAPNPGGLATAAGLAAYGLTCRGDVGVED